MRTRTPARSQGFIQSSLLSVLSLVFILPLTGCDHLRLALGMRTSLAKVPVVAMEPSLPNGSAIAPGQKSPLVVTFTDDKGKTWATEGKGKGRIQWRDVAVVPELVTVDKKGVLSLVHDPRVSQGKVGHVTIQVPSHPTLKPAELDIPLTYAYAFQAAYSGGDGSNGTDGSAGTDGSSGSDGSIDPNNPSAGGNGSDGSSGGSGTDGGDGGNGPGVQAWITLLPGPQPLLQAKVTVAGHKDRFYLIDPTGGSLTIKSDGGSGGRGGAGGKGGSGGSGGSGSPPGSSGNSGSNGTDGSSGSNGSNGPVSVTYDPAVQPYLAKIIVPKRDVSTSTFTQAPVAPLW